MTDIKLGRRVLRDPSGLKREITNYEKFLDKKFRGAEVKLDGAGDSPANINDRVDTAMNGILSESEKRVLQNVGVAQQAGYLRSNQFMLASGIVSARNLPADPSAPLSTQATQILQQRNLAALRGITEETGKVIKSELSAGILAGEGSRELANRITHAVEDIGITRATTMARTETMFSFNTAAKENYARHGVSEVEWLVAQDDRLCDICAPLNEKRYPIGEAPDCPKHPNCRCVLLPVITEVPA